MPLPGVSQRQLREAAARPAPRLGSAPPSRYHAPVVYAPQHSPAPAAHAPATPAGRPWSSIPSSHPFAQAQQQAAKHVQQTQRALPPERLRAPILPIVSRPTAGQGYAALDEARRFQDQHLGANPSRQRELQFHREVMSDPRNAGFVQALSHYIRSLNIAGGVNQPFRAGGQEGGARSVLDAAVSGSRMQSPNERAQRERSERGWQQQAVKMLRESAAERQAHQGDMSVPLLGTINPVHLATALSKVKVPGSGSLGIVGQAINEAVDMPAQTFLAGAQLGAGTRAGFDRGDALGGLLYAPKAIGQQALNIVKDPIGQFKEAPLATALIAAGGESALARAVGRVGRPVRGGMLWDRPGLAGKTVERAFSTSRKDLGLYGDRLPSVDAVPGARRVFTAGPEGVTEGLRLAGRRYSSDPLRKAVFQKSYEAALPKLPGVLKQADPFQATGWRLKRAVSGGYLKVGAADIQAGAGEKGRRSILRGTVNKVLAPAENGGVNAKVGRDAIPYMVENVFRPGSLKADIQKELAKVKHWNTATKEDGTPALVGEDRATNKANLKALEGLLADEKFMADPSEAFGAARRYNALHKPMIAARLFGGQLKQDQLRAALFPYAQAHMGATHHTPEDHVAAEAKAISEGHSQARVDAVSGRDPRGIAAHREAHDNLSQAASAVKDAEKHVAKAQRAYDRRTALQQSARARPEPVPAGEVRTAGRGPRASTPAEIRAMAVARDELKAARQAHAEAKATHAEHREIVRANPLPEREAAMRGPHGEHLPDQVILDHMKAHGVPLDKNGVPEVGFISHQHRTGTGQYFRSLLRQPSLEHHLRTGRAFEQGTVPRSWEQLVGNIARHASEAAQLEGQRRLLNRFAIGQHKDARMAQVAAKNFMESAEGQRIAEKHGLGGLVTVHLGSKQIVDKEHIAPVPHEDVLRQFGLDEHTAAEHRELGTYASIPKAVYARLKQHDEALSAGKAGRALQAYQRGFRQAKLNTSMPHYFGVMQEQAIRLLMEQAGPTAWKVGRKWDRQLKHLAEVDKHGYIADSHGPLGEYFRQIENTIGGRGGLASTQRWQDATQKVEHFQESLLYHVLQAGQGALRGHPAKALASSWRALRAVMEGSLAQVEHASYHAHLGKALREGGLIDNYRSVLKAQDRAVQAMVEGKMTPNMADSLARRVDDMMGNWTHQTPLVREAVGKLAPFGLWWLNSMRWLYRLPVTHPIKTGILAAMYEATRQARNAEGQGYDAEKRVPAFLQGAVDSERLLGLRLPGLGKGAKVAPSYYSPGGTAGPEAFHTFAEQIFPAGSSAYAAAVGTSGLTGEKLKDPHGEDLGFGEAGANVLAELLAGPTPFATQLQTAMQGGGKPYGTANWITDLAHELGAGPSQVRPGTKHSVGEILGKMFSPTRAIRPRATSGGRSGPLGQLQQELRKARQSSGGAGADEARSKLREELAAARKRGAGR